MFATGVIYFMESDFQSGGDMHFFNRFDNVVEEESICTYIDFIKQTSNREKLGQNILIGEKTREIRDAIRKIRTKHFKWKSTYIKLSLDKWTNKLNRLYYQLEVSPKIKFIYCFVTDNNRKNKFNVMLCDEVQNALNRCLNPLGLEFQGCGTEGAVWKNINRMYYQGHLTGNAIEQKLVNMLYIKFEGDKIYKIETGSPYPLYGGNCYGKIVEAIFDRNDSSCYITMNDGFHDDYTVGNFSVENNCTVTAVYESKQ